VACGLLCATLTYSDIRYTNVPNIRLKYRREVLCAEHDVVNFTAKQHLPASEASRPHAIPTRRRASGTCNGATQL